MNSATAFATRVMPSAAQTLFFLRRPYDYLESRARYLGDPFPLAISGAQRGLCFSAPEAVREIFAENQSLGSALDHHLAVFLGEHSLLLMSGARHLRHRQLLMPPFHGDRLRRASETIAELAQRHVAAAPLDTTILSHRLFVDISLETILRVIFGVDDPARLSELGRALSLLLERMTPGLLFFAWLRRDLGPRSPWPRYQAAARVVDRLIYAMVAERRLAAAKDDILGLMLAARSEDGTPLSDSELRDELITLLIAGHDTSSAALSWAVHWLARSGGVRETLQAEVDACSGSAEDLAKLPYLDAVCKETLRLRPVLPLVSRRVLADVEIAGRICRTGSFVWAGGYLTHRREELYPQAARFEPERFLRRKYAPWEYFPFGGGVRRCIGQAFALLQMRVVLGTLVRMRSIAHTSAAPSAPLRRNLVLLPADRGAITLLPRAG
jgi:cytochrome P450